MIIRHTCRKHLHVTTSCH